jgi:hypothetical protein
VDDVPPPEAELSALSASLQSDVRDSTVFFGVLCTALQTAIPASTTVERQRSLVRSRRLARRLTVRLGDDTFETELHDGRLVCRQMHAVSGVGGGLPYSKELGVQQWTAALVAALAHDAGAAAAATEALRSLTT